MTEILCYNRGCGKTYKKRDEDQECTYHPGAPFFHDAYKGWTCCQNKSTDFTTFLNTPGCTQGKHSNVKPIEPEKITGNLTKEESPEKVVEVRSPIVESMPRPPYSTPLVRLKPTVAASLQAQTVPVAPTENGTAECETKMGESCKNNGCKKTYEGPEGDYTNCKHHPGIPVFHEGLKYWSCCVRKTTEFQLFLEQEGCELGTCVWTRKEGQEGVVTCRYDWHQTASTVTVAIYAKKYDPAASFVEISPIRLKAHIYFPQEKGGFDLDLELRGVVDVDGSSVSMLGTKTEIKMKKAESGSWARLDIPRSLPEEQKQQDESLAQAEEQVDALDLDDIDMTSQRYQLSKDARTHKYT